MQKINIKVEIDYRNGLILQKEYQVDENSFGSTIDELANYFRSPFDPQEADILVELCNKWRDNSGKILPKAPAFVSEICKYVLDKNGNKKKNPPLRWMIADVNHPEFVRLNLRKDGIYEYIYNAYN
jgi:predicted nucleic acid-binding Zn ribbon protein